MKRAPRPDGWCLGSDSFRQEMMERLDGVIGGKGKRESFSGSQAREHDEAEALRLLESGLDAFGIDRAALRSMTFKHSFQLRPFFSFCNDHNAVIAPPSR